MIRPARWSVLLTISLALAGCGGKKARTTTDVPKVEPRYQALTPKAVPDWLKGSIYEQCDVIAEPLRISNYGLVVNLRGTGDAENVPNAVRDYMLREMIKRGFGSASQPGFENIAPEAVIRDPRVSIVRVDGFIPPGAFKGQRIDILVSALENNNTSSLSGGMLYLTDLYPNGANPVSPGGVDMMANARGPVFVNPAYALDPNLDDANQRRSLRRGVIMAGARVLNDRPILLRVRAAEFRLSRLTEQLLDRQFVDTDIAAAQDEGRILVRVPPRFKGDWEHFSNVVLHTYYNGTSQVFAATKSRQLADEMQKPDAPLRNLSYALEALGKPALPAIIPLYAHSDPEVSFAAVRAGAFIGDISADEALLQIASNPANPFRINAVQTLARLPNSPSVNSVLRQLLSGNEPMVRVEAYRALIDNQDPIVYTKPIGERFFIDIAPGDGPPLVYVTRSGMPRIAFLGQTSSLRLPLIYASMQNTFSVSSLAGSNKLTMFYRGNAGAEPIKVVTNPDLAEFTARLGGEGPAAQPAMSFSYGEIVAMLGQLADQKALVAKDKPGTTASLIVENFNLGSNDPIDTAPTIPEGPRPIGTAAQPPQTALDEAREAVRQAQ
jgi:hypothetical protein